MIDFKSMVGRSFICLFCGFPQGKIAISKQGKPFYSCLACHSKIFLNRDIALKGFIACLDWARTAQMDRMREMSKETIETAHRPIVTHKPVTSTPEPVKTEGE